MRFLPPLLVLLVLGTVAVRCAQNPHREEARVRITGLIQGANLERAREVLEDYTQRYTTIEDRWFASGMWFRLRDPVRALDTIWNDPAIAGAEGTARRFAETGLLAIGWETEDRRDPTMMEPWVLIALAEGGHDWAQERLAQYGRELQLEAAILYFFPAYRQASRAPLETLVTAFRERGEEIFDVAAALGALRAEDYPEKARDIASLRKVLVSEDWRRTYRDVWMVAAIALGRSGDPGALEALQGAAARLEGSVDERDRGDLARVRLGLLTAGRFEVDPPLAKEVFGRRPDLQVTSWYMEALIHRYRSGDKRSELRLRQIWEGPGARVRPLRSRIARAFLLQDTRLSDEAVQTFVGRMVRELEAPDGPLIGHVLGRAWRLRAGEDGARDGLLEVLRRAAEAFTSGEAEAIELAEPFVEALRALYLYG
ncbi:MAG: hypothetical protein QNJ90_15200 [Planctomycetota bacterium]|nr:hypothetical protein [Planctomycetota bacterium]